jgi:UDP-GlcNAc:undecaprenyl-phosphate GlcNAc-1-phosphate transferase
VGAMLIGAMALAITALFVEAARRVAPVVGLVDAPSARKFHDGNIPQVGGIAIFGALLLVGAMSGSIEDHRSFFIAAGLLVTVGACDDMFDISPVLRFAVQSLAILIPALLGGAYIADLGAILPLVGILQLGWLAIPFTVFAGVGTINAFNLVDGVDGLCGTLALVALGGLGIAAGFAGRESELALILALSGGLLGFLYFNIRLPRRKQAIVFLGDAGSYLLGLSVVYFSIRLSQGPERAISPVTALWFCLMPLLDTGGMMLRRMRRGRSPFSPDREHLHHVFLWAKFSVNETWGMLVLAAIAGMIFGLAGSFASVPDSLMFAAFLFVAVIYFGMFTRVWKALRFLRRSINRRTLAMTDRRIRSERRQNTQVFNSDGFPSERRSGMERRKVAGDRRTTNGLTADNVRLGKNRGAIQ